MEKSRNWERLYGISISLICVMIAAGLSAHRQGGEILNYSIWDSKGILIPYFMGGYTLVLFLLDLFSSESKAPLMFNGVLIMMAIGSALAGLHIEVPIIAFLLGVFILIFSFWIEKK